jgi:hypothetical protein
MYGIEKGRGQCECYSSREDTKIIKNGAVSNQLTNGGMGSRECVGSDSE